jgi:myo-inositol-1-phosphate synthase
VVAGPQGREADVLVCYLPVGSEQAAKFYAQCAIDAGVAFVNALPVFIASDPEWAAKFEAAGVPIVGDDIKSQVGATITHRVLAKLFEDRGVALDRTYQLNVGGNMDFKNMLERERLESKKISKTQAVTSSSLGGVGADAATCTSARPTTSPGSTTASGRTCASRARNFGDVPLNLEYKLEVWDSPNSAGIIIDAIRAAKIAQGPRHRWPDPVGVVLLHEVPARAARGQRGPGEARGLHCGDRRALTRSEGAPATEPRRKRSREFRALTPGRLTRNGASASEPVPQEAPN